MASNTTNDAILNSVAQENQPSQSEQQELSPQNQRRSHKSGEIWSMRVQQELLALITTEQTMILDSSNSVLPTDESAKTTDTTTTDSSFLAMDTTTTTTTTNPKSSKMLLLPPFVTIADHALDIAAGTCVITVTVNVVLPPQQPPPPPPNSGDQDQKRSTDTTSPRYESVMVAVDVSMATTTTTTTTTTADSSREARVVVPDSQSYPFVPPKARLQAGSALFPAGSTIADGDAVAIDLDWTPSLHVSDAILNVALKIRESIAQAEPFHAAPTTTTTTTATRAADDSESYEDDPIDKVVGEVVDEVKKGARRFASTLGSLGKKAFAKSTDTTAATTSSTPTTTRTKTGRSVKPNKSVPTSGTTVAALPVLAQNVKIGDEINLLEEPWVGAKGVYSCKAIRRPPFIEQVIAAASSNNSSTPRKDDSPAPHFASPTSMFRSLAQSARSVMEESFLMITDMHIIELRASKLNMQLGTVTFCIPIEFMAKLKFRRQESLSLFFKTAPEDPLVYMCPDAGDVVHQIQAVLKEKGVRGKHTNAAAYRAINEALEMIKVIQAKELALDHSPSVQTVNEIMDLYRQAAEKFESAGDIRHEEVVTHMRKFLAKSSTIGILESAASSPAVPDNEQLGLSASAAPLSSLESPTEPSGKGNDSAASADVASTVETSLKSDLEKYGIEYDDDDDYDEYGNPIDKDNSPALATDFSTDDIDDMAADLDAMMKEADKELAELMNS
jgi:hypothetical protein